MVARRMPDLPPAWQVPEFVVGEFSPRRTKYAVGIPVINEGERIGRQLARMHSLGLHEFADIVLADGGSLDGSTAPGALRAWGVRALLTKIGPGHLSAQLRMFFAYTIVEGYQGFVIVDGNDKDGVEAVPAFLKALDEDWDYIQGSRYMRGGVHTNTPLVRMLAARFVHAPILSMASGFRYTDTTNGFRALSRRLLEDPRVSPFRDVFDTYNLHYYLSLVAPRLGYRVKEIPVARSYPSGGLLPSKIRGLRAYAHVLKELLLTVMGAYTPRERQ